jgi:hypothetical protein
MDLARRYQFPWHGAPFWRQAAASAAVLAGVLLALVVVVPRLPFLREPASRRAVPQAQGWWQRHRNETDRYVLALPPDWRVLPLDPEAVPAASESASPGEAEVFARMAEAARDERAAGWGVWAAAAPDGPLGDTTTLNVVRQPLERPISAEQFARASLASLKEVAGPSIRYSQEWLSLTPGKALRVEAVVRPTPDGREFTLVQYYLVKGRDGYVITGIAPAGEERQIETFEAIVRSLRWTV